jgi:hypothetical protein
LFSLTDFLNSRQDSDGSADFSGEPAALETSDTRSAKTVP